MAKKFNQQIFASVLVIFLLKFPASSFSSDAAITDQSKTYVCPYPCLPPPMPVNWPPPPPLPPLPPGPPLPPPLPPSPPLTPPLPPGPPLPPPFPGPPFPPRPPFPFTPPWPIYAPPPPNPILPYFPWYYKNPPPPPDDSSAMPFEVFSLVMAIRMIFLPLLSFFL